jgi:hemolysin activation/secretion protein
MLKARLGTAGSLVWLVLGVLGALCDGIVEASDAPATAAQATFDINEFRVLGNHLLPPATIERAVYPFLGPNRSIDTVKQATEALEKAYKEAGYGTVYVDIPEQEVTDGLVRLKVTEGTLGSLHVRGERYFLRRQIVAGLPTLEIGKTPNLPLLQEELTALNARSPDRQLTPVLKAGAQPGEVEADIVVKDTLPLHGSIQYDDRHTAETTPNRATAALSYDNLWQRQDSIGIQYQTAPAKPSDAEVFSANYLAHLDFAGAQAAFSYIHTDSDVLAVGTLGVLGKGSIYGAHWLQPLSVTPSTSQSLSMGADYKDVLTSVLPNSPEGTPGAAVTTKVNYINWSVVYSGAWFAQQHTYTVSGGIDFGARGLLNSPNEFENARYNAKPDYFYVRVGAGGSQILPFGIRLSERLNSQWADSPLVNNEQFSLGGSESVRGYLEAEFLGDSGATGSFEIHSPFLGARAGAFLSQLYGFTFLDGGVASLVDPLPSQIRSLTLLSTGAGLRLENSYGVTTSVDYAFPLRNGVNTPKNHSRIEFLLRYGF